MESIPRSNLLSLPSELLTKIIEFIAVSSANDLIKIKLVCNYLKNVAEQECIYKCVSLDDFVGWIHKENKRNADLIFNNCLLYKNPEALYYQGVVDYFSHRNKESALNNLKDATYEGHKRASYAMAIIYLFSDEDEERKIGETLLLSLKKLTRMSIEVKKSRINLWKIIREMRWNSCLLFGNKDGIERRECLSQGNKCGGDWHDEDPPLEDYEKTCEACKIDEEVGYVLNYIPNK